MHRDPRVKAMHKSSKVPKDGTQSAKEVDTKDDVETAEVDAKTADGEFLGADGHGELQATPSQETRLPLATAMSMVG
jgi:hypothetical protein